MNFLALAQKTAEKCSISGTLVSVLGQRGELLRVVNWVNEAWYDLQMSQPGWDWMREDFSFQTVIGQRTYTPAQANAPLLTRWHTDTLRTFKTVDGVAGEQFLCEWDYNVLRDTYMLGTPESGPPSVFAIKPKGSSLLLAPIPDAVYTVSGEYQRRASSMEANTDVPDMPEEYHMAIVHGARMKYAAFENAPEVMAEAVRDYSRITTQLAMTQLGEISTGSPLA